MSVPELEGLEAEADDEKHPEIRRQLGRGPRPVAMNTDNTPHRKRELL